MVTSTTTTLSAITAEGRVLQVRAAELADGSGRSRGSGAAQIFGTNRGEEIRTVAADGDESLVLVTEAGTVKRLTTKEVQSTTNTKQVITLKAGDRVAAAFCAPDGVDVILATSDGQVLRTPIGGISIQGRGAAGVAGMKLRRGAKVIGAGAVLGDDLLITVTNGKSAKATPVSEFETRKRGGVGVRVTKLPGATTITLAQVATPLELLAVMADDENPGKTDPNPVALTLEASKRDLASTATERQILTIGPSRW
jgi:DNA gyrase subunit A